MNDDLKKLQPCFSRPLEEDSRGGLIVCGINWGGDPDEAAELFEHESFVTQAEEHHYPFHNTLRKWFEFWGCDLGNACSPLDRKISHTNYFMDQSRWMISDRSQDKVDESLPNLVEALSVLRPRGLLMCSVQHSLGEADDFAWKHRDNAAARMWFEFCGSPRWREHHTFGDGRVNFQTVILRHHPEGQSQVAAISHPSPSGPAPKDEDVKMARNVMEPW